MKKKRFLLISLIILIITGVFLVNTAIDILYPLKYEDIIIEKSEKYGLDPLLVASLINVESSYKYDAISRRNAKGLMQISETTEKWASSYLTLREGYDIYNPEINIEIGCWLLEKLCREFGKENMDTVLAAYNAGIGNVSEWLTSEKYSKNGDTLYYIPFPETENYILKMDKNMKIYKFLYSNKLRPE